MANGCALSCAPTYTHAQVADVLRMGDKLELVRSSTLEVVKELEVLEVRHELEGKDSEVRLSESLPEDVGGYYLFNVTKLPELRFCRSVVWGHLARGVLAKTRKVKIKENVFRGCTRTAIHVGAESGWKEGTHAEVVLIEDNVIIGCGLGAGTQYGASGIAVVIDAPDTRPNALRGKVRIAGNTIVGTGSNEFGIVVRNTCGVKLMNNAVKGCKKDVLLHSVTDIATE